MNNGEQEQLCRDGGGRLWSHGDQAVGGGKAFTGTESDGASPEHRAVLQQALSGGQVPSFPCRL